MRTNEKPGTCEGCHGEVAVGAGSLWWEPGPDDGGDAAGRRPAGWRVQHLDKTLCAAELTRRAAAADDRKAAGARKLAAEATAFEAERDAIRRVIDSAVAEHGLMVMPKNCQLPRATTACELYRKAAYPAGGGSSTGVEGCVIERDDGIVASFGALEGGAAQQWTTPALIAAGLRQYRVYQWWIPGTYPAKDYPGPAVPEADLSIDERAEVTRLRDEQKEAQRAEVIRSLEIGVRHARELQALLALPGATFTIDPGSGLDAYLAARAARSASVRLQAVLTVRLPADHFAKGKLRAKTAKLVHDQVPLNNVESVLVRVCCAE